MNGDGSGSTTKKNKGVVLIDDMALSDRKLETGKDQSLQNI